MLSAGRFEYFWEKHAALPLIGDIFLAKGLGKNALLIAGNKGICCDNYQPEYRRPQLAPRPLPGPAFVRRYYLESLILTFTILQVTDLLLFIF